MAPPTVSEWFPVLGSHRPRRPSVGAWIVDYRRGDGFRRIKWISSSIDPELSIERSGARHIVRARHWSTRGPGIGRNVVVVEGSDDRVRGIASTSYIDVAVDDRRTCATECGWHVEAGRVEGVGDWIVFPDLPEGG